MLFLDYTLLYHTNHRSVDINKRNRITRKMFFTCFNVTSFTFLPLSEQIAGEVECAGEVLKQKYYPKVLLSTITSVTSSATLCGKGLSR
jgi:hypothetical protein